MILCEEKGKVVFFILRVERRSLWKYIFVVKFDDRKMRNCNFLKIYKVSYQLDVCVDGVWDKRNRRDGEVIKV